MDYFKIDKKQNANSCPGVYSKALGEIWHGFSMNASTLKVIENQTDYVFFYGQCNKPI